MALNVHRLRWWIAAAGMALAVVVAGSYFYGRMRVRRAISDVPRQLGVNVQQSTEGFSLSKSEGGRTVFTIRASKAVQYKQGGKAELRDVSIIVYGRKANRFDQIYGSDFEYDPRTGNVSARGEVHIDLEGNAEGPVRPDQAQPQELKNPIHLKTSGLVFNQKTGVAETHDVIEFRVPQASGSALGATYDSKAATLTLDKQIRVYISDQHASELSATHGVITKGPNRAILDTVHVQSTTGNFSTQQLTVFFRDDNTIEHATAIGDIKAGASGRTAVDVRAQRADAWVTARNVLHTATLSGGVELAASGQQNLHAQSGKVELSFGERSRLQKVTASDDVRVLQKPPVRSNGHPVELAANSIVFLVQNGHFVTQATTTGAAEVAVLPSTTASGEAAVKTVVTAGRFDARLQQNRLVSVVGAPDARLVTSSPGQPDKVSTSERVAVAFDSSGGIGSLVQDGNFQYVEEVPGARREAWADRAAYSPATSALVMSGSPRIVDGGMTTTASTVRIDRRTGDASATGDVKTTYSELKPQPGGALLASGDPIHVTARTMSAKRSTGTARYIGARLWQGANVLEAAVLDFQREPRRVEAHGQGGQGVTTVFVAQDKTGRVTPVNVTAARLVYIDATRQARFDGGVTVRGSDATVTAAQIDVFLRGRGANAKAAATPSEIDRIVAAGNVVIQQQSRRATGQTLVYTALDGKFVLTGGPPSIFDAERGQITGDSLTFYQRDDRVLVESKTSPAVTHTRVAK